MIEEKSEKIWVSKQTQNNNKTGSKVSQNKLMLLILERKSFQKCALTWSELCYRIQTKQQIQYYYDSMHVFSCMCTKVHAFWIEERVFNQTNGRTTSFLIYSISSAVNNNRSRVYMKFSTSVNVCLFVYWQINLLVSFCWHRMIANWKSFRGGIINERIRVRTYELWILARINKYRNK